MACHLPGEPSYIQWWLIIIETVSNVIQPNFCENLNDFIQENDCKINIYWVTNILASGGMS